MGYLILILNYRQYHDCLITGGESWRQLFINSHSLLFSPPIPPFFLYIFPLKTKISKAQLLPLIMSLTSSNVKCFCCFNF